MRSARRRLAACKRGGKRMRNPYLFDIHVSGTLVGWYLGIVRHVVMRMGRIGHFTVQ